jgi:hypothetical protein
MLTCALQLEQWAPAADAAGSVIKCDDKCVKAYFRRGLARAGAGDDESAVTDLRAAAKLAPTDGGIRKELTAAKARLAAVPVAPSQVSSAVLSTAFSGGLYPEHKEVKGVGDELEKGDGIPESDAKEKEAHLYLTQAAQLVVEGRYAEALAQCKCVFTKCLRLGFHPEELVLQRFRARVLSAQCHTLVATSPDTLEADRGIEHGKAREALKTAISYLDREDIRDSGVIPADELDRARAAWLKSY